MLTAVGHLNRECAISLKEQLREFLGDRKQDRFSSVAQVLSEHLRRDNSECL